MKSTTLFIIAVLVFTAVLGNLVASARDNTNRYLRVWNVDTYLDFAKTKAAKRDSLPTSMGQEDHGGIEKVQLLVTLSEEGSFEEQKKMVEQAAGHSMGHYIGPRTFVLTSHVEDLERIRALPVVQSIGEYKPEHKYEKHIIERYQSLTPRSGSGGQSRNEINGIHAKEDDFLAQLGRDFARYQLHHDEEATGHVVLDVLLERSIPFDSTSVTAQTRAATCAGHVRSRLESALIEVKYLHASPEKITISIDRNSWSKAAAVLSSLPFVHWIEPRTTNQVLNKYARWITQSGEIDQTPLSDYGLTGANQLIGVGDTGLDVYSCFFYDPNNTVSYIADPKSPFTSGQHRKVHAYYKFMDDVDYEAGHGTHISGSLVGQATNPSRAFLQDFNGMAENAKAIFTDIGCSQVGGCVCPASVECECNFYDGRKCPPDKRTVYLPVDLEQDYFSLPHEMGAKIHSNSWGGGSGLGYSSSTRELDSFVWNHQDFLILFAAGNQGNLEGYASISTHAEAKNVLSVGASMVPRDSFLLAAEKLQDFDQIASDMADFLFLLAQCVWTGPNDELYLLCKFLSNFTTEDQCCSETGMCTPGPNITESCGCTLLEEINIGQYCCSACALEAVRNPKTEHQYGIGNLAGFSGRGPTADGRIKPDIVAPGHHILSALSTGSNATKACPSSTSLGMHLHTMSGTSMATSVAAGSAALVREYYLRGFHRNGSENIQEGFEPSAALIKATIINSAQPLDGYVDMGEKLSWMKIEGDENALYNLNPLLLQGFGRIQLSNTLMFENSPHTLLVGRANSNNNNNNNNNSRANQNSDPLIVTGERHVYCVKTIDSDSVRLRATLVWTDYPSSPAARFALVNNLDLGIKTPNNEYFWGNINNPNVKARDFVNNVEQATVDKVKPDSTYIIAVEGSLVPHGPQPYALVITGDIEFLRQDECHTALFDNGVSNGNNNHKIIMIALFSVAIVVITAVLGSVIVYLGIKVHKLNNLTKYRAQIDENPAQ